MVKKIKSLLVLLLAITLPVLTCADDIHGNYAVWGVGAKSCFAYNKESKDGELTNYRSYIKGFLTAYNIFTKDTYNISGKMHEGQIAEWLHSYCDDNPMSSVESALVNFIADHYDKRMKSARPSLGR